MGPELGRRERGWRARFVQEDEDVVKGRYRLNGGIVEVGKDLEIDVWAAVNRAIEENDGRKPRILGGGCGLGVPTPSRRRCPGGPGTSGRGVELLGGSDRLRT